ncbi:MAG: hypothetical protein JJT75_04225 [Opitutales bacterium]|nr:hypothetical protein [Opitutales bacterium]MCH8540036.1 hypothetical protein [Opitutales bacterium]
MDSFYAILLVFLLLNIVVSMFRVWRGPTTADRLMTAQLFGTTGVAILLLLSEWTGQEALRDVALVFVLLAVLVIVCFVRSGNSPGRKTKGGAGGG